MDWFIAVLIAIGMFIFAPIQEIFSQALSLGIYNDLEEGSKVAVSSMVITFYVLLIQALYKSWPTIKKFIKWSWNKIFQ